MYNIIGSGGTWSGTRMYIGYKGNGSQGVKCILDRSGSAER